MHAGSLDLSYNLSLLEECRGVRRLDTVSKRGGSEPCVSGLRQSLCCKICDTRKDGFLGTLIPRLRFCKTGGGWLDGGGVKTETEFVELIHECRVPSVRSTQPLPR